jgi:hypothetical protein
MDYAPVADDAQQRGHPDAGGSRGSLLGQVGAHQRRIWQNPRPRRTSRPTARKSWQRNESVIGLPRVRITRNHRGGRGVLRLRAQTAVGATHRVGKMASTRDLPQLLEPSNLLEPLDLTEQRLDFVYPLTRPHKDETSQKGFGRTTARPPALRASESQRRSPLKSLLMVAGAVACFGAGTVFPQFHNLTQDLRPGSIVGASQPSSQIAEVATKSDEASPVEPSLTERISGERKSAAATSNESPTSPARGATPAAPAASSAEGAVAQPAQAVPHAQPASAVKNALADCPAECNQQPCPKGDANCLEGGALSPPQELTTTDGSAANPAANTQPVRTATPQSADSERPQTRASALHRSKRAVQRERTDQQALAKRNSATGTHWSRVQDRGVEWNFDQGSNWRWDRTDGRWQERDADRASNWRRDRYDDYGRDGNRRFTSVRDGNFQMGRAERREGPMMMMLPPARYPW